jgi:hypothetical protein
MSSEDHPAGITDIGHVAGVPLPKITQVTGIMDHDPGVQAGIFSYDIHPVRGFPGAALPG